MERLAREKIATQQRLAELKNELSQCMDVLEIDRVLRQTIQPEDDQASTSTASGRAGHVLAVFSFPPFVHVDGSDCEELLAHHSVAVSCNDTPLFRFRKAPCDTASIYYTNHAKTCITQRHKTQPTTTHRSLSK